MKNFILVTLVTALFFLVLANRIFQKKGLKNPIMFKFEKNKTKIDLSNSQITNSDLLQLEKFSSLKEVNLRNTKITSISHLKRNFNIEKLYLCDSKITGEGLKNLSNLKKIQILGLGGCRINNLGLNHLKGLKKLKKLNISDCHITDLTSLKFLNNLEELELDWNNINDLTLSNLQKFSKLRYLNLSNTKISNRGMKIISNIKSLEKLALDATNIDDLGIMHIQKLENLLLLNLNRTLISDKGVIYLKKLKKLETIYLIYAKNITNKSIDILGEIKTLKKIFIIKTQVTKNAINRLRTMLPHCKIWDKYPHAQ